jgi:hypothetical protein
MLVLLCSGAVLLASGCGGSGGGGHRLSEAAFRVRANHICTGLTRQEKPDLSSSSKASVDRNLGRIDDALGQLEGLRPPAGDEARYHALLTRFKRSVAFVKAKEPLLIELTHQLRSHSSDSRTMARYQRIVRPFLRDVARAGADARALGLGACANGLSGSSG